MTKETDRGKGQVEPGAGVSGTGGGAHEGDPVAPAAETLGQEGVREEPATREPDGDIAAAGGAADPARRNEELLDNFLRLKAEFENYRKRMLKEQTRMLETAESGLVRKLMPVIDNLERALENAPAGKDASGLRKGVEMVLDQLLDVLAREGLEVIDPGGEPFDPEHHEAMMVVETDDCPEDTVVDVAQKGYRFNGMMLRPAMVRVSCPVKG